MEMKAETSKVLMSEVLRGRVPEEIENEAAQSIENGMVTVLIQVQRGPKRTSIPGILRSVLFEAEPELEAKVELDEALNIIEAKDLQLLGFELHHGDRVIQVPGPFWVKGTRIDEINPLDGMCLLMLGLKRPPKA